MIIDKIKDTWGLIAFLIMVLLMTPLVIMGGILWIVSSKIIKSKKMTKYSINILYTIDQAGNTIFGGHPDETISSRLGRAKLAGERHWWVKLLRVVVDFLAAKLFADYNHCERSILPLEQEHFKKARMELWDWNRQQ